MYCKYPHNKYLVMCAPVNAGGNEMTHVAESSYSERFYQYSPLQKDFNMENPHIAENEILLLLCNFELW